MPVMAPTIVVMNMETKKRPINSGMRVQEATVHGCRRVEGRGPGIHVQLEYTYKTEIKKL